MNIKAEDLKDVVDVLRRVAVNASIKTSQFVRLRAVKEGVELCTQCDTLARFTVPVDGKPDFSTFHVERASFFPFVSAAAAGAIAVEVVKGKLTLKQGRRRAAFADVEPGKYQSFTVPDNVVKLSEHQLHLVKAARRYALDDVGEPRFNCVMLDNNSIMGASHVAFFHAKTDDFGVNVPLSLAVCDLFDKWNPALYATAKATAAVFTNGALYHPLSTACLEEFPGALLYNRVREIQKTPVQFATKAGRLLDALRSVQAITAGSVVEDMVLTIRPGADKLTLGVSGQAVSVTETVKATNVKATAKEELLLVSILPFVQFAAEEKADAYVEFRYLPKSGYLLTFEKSSILAARRDTTKAS